MKSFKIYMLFSISFSIAALCYSAEDKTPPIQNASLYNALADVKSAGIPVSYTHLTLPTNREV